VLGVDTSLGRPTLPPPLRYRHVQTIGDETIDRRSSVSRPWIPNCHICTRLHFTLVEEIPPFGGVKAELGGVGTSVLLRCLREAFATSLGIILVVSSRRIVLLGPLS
jgi:hypothetical protein